MASSGGGPVKRKRDDVTVSLEDALEKTTRHLANDEAGPKFEKAFSAYLKCLAHISGENALLFLSSFCEITRDPVRVHHAQYRDVYCGIFRAVEHHYHRGVFDALPEQAQPLLQALIVQGCYHNQLLTDDTTQFERAAKGITLIVEGLPRVYSGGGGGGAVAGDEEGDDAMAASGGSSAATAASSGGEPATASGGDDGDGDDEPAPLHAALLDAFLTLVEMYRLPWARPAIEATMRTAAARRQAFHPVSRAKLDELLTLLHAKKTASSASIPKAASGGSGGGGGGGTVSPGEEAMGRAGGSM